MNLKCSAAVLRQPSPVELDSQWTLPLDALPAPSLTCAAMAAAPAAATSAASVSAATSVTTRSTLPLPLPVTSASASASASESEPSPISSTWSATGAERRRSVEFNLDASVLIAATQAHYKDSADADIRCRSMSSTWETSDDSEDEDDDVDDDESSAVNPLATQQRAYPASSPMRCFSTGTLLAGHKRRDPRFRAARGTRRRRDRRIRIVSPASSRIAFGGWMRGQPAEVHWEVIDTSVQFVRIDLCNLAWNVPTTIALRVPNSGSFRWKRVYWGLPIRGGYFIKMYDVTDAPEPDAAPHGLRVLSDEPISDAALLTTSEYFSMLG